MSSIAVKARRVATAINPHHHHNNNNDTVITILIIIIIIIVIAVIVTIILRRSDYLSVRVCWFYAPKGGGRRGARRQIKVFGCLEAL